MMEKELICIFTDLVSYSIYYLKEINLSFFLKNKFSYDFKSLLFIKEVLLLNLYALFHISNIYDYHMINHEFKEKKIFYELIKENNIW